MSTAVRFTHAKYSFLRPIAVIIALFALIAGKCNQGKCDEYALVSDQSGLDGCGLLFEVSDGSLLLPSNLDDYDLALAEGDTVSISYKVIPDAMSICMRENATVVLSCIDKVSR